MLYCSAVQLKVMPSLFGEKYRQLFVAYKLYNMPLSSFIFPSDYVWRNDEEIEVHVKKTC